MTASRKSAPIRSRRARVLVIYKKSSYQIYVRERKNKRIQALLDAGDPSVARLMRAHEDHTAAMQEVRAVLKTLGTKARFRYRKDSEVGGDFDLVVTLGGDGTVLRASQGVGSCPMIAVNTSPRDSVGFFCAGTRGDIGAVLRDALAGKLKETRVSRMRVSVDDRLLSNRVLNDVLFAHAVPSATTRYRIRLDDQEEIHKSSGVWIGTAAGSTAALHSAGGRKMPITSRRLQFVVREPYLQPGQRVKLRQGFVGPAQQLEIGSHTRSGKLYLDGSRAARKAEIGSTIWASLSDEPLTLLGFGGRS